MPEVLFAGPEGRLEGRYTHSKIKDAPLALILHPSPELGGTMNNKITYLMHQAFAARGFSTLRFNFRGVGRSQGLYDHGEGELSDAAAALDWMQEINKNAPYVWIGGFAFGAWIGMQLLMRRPEVQGFVSVAPPTNTQDFTFLAPCPTSGLILQGSKDDVVTEESILDFIEKIQIQKGIQLDYRQVEGANHFFHNHEDEMVAHIHDHLDKANAGRTLLEMENDAQVAKLLSAAG